MRDIKFSKEIQDIFDVLSQTATAVNDEALLFGGYIRDTIYYGYCNQDMDIVLKNGNNFQFVDLLTSYGASDPKVYPNTGTISTVFNDITIEIQSSTNALVHFDVDSQLEQNGVEVNWYTRNVYERDFTINTIIYDLNKKRIVDLTGVGISDLTEDKKLRCPLGPHVAIKNNPLVINRAIKFAIQFDLEIEKEFIEIAKDYKEEFLHKIKERNNNNYIKSYISKSFDMDFDRCYNYYKEIDFLKIIPMNDETKDMVAKRNIGIKYIHTNKNEKVDNKMQVKMNHDKEKNILRLNCLKADLNGDYVICINDLITKKVIDENIQVLYLDGSREEIPNKIASMVKESLDLPYNENIYDAIRGRKDYRDRKRKETKKKNLEYFKYWKMLNNIIEGKGVSPHDRKKGSGTK